ncbi:MAG: hypothetical protein AMS27_04715 [Bacteroides sp. SM23_62_1]|nr:MAG: hypothetical protein AMS27_04715 [Bacteroides sp. SM23_62_1]
MGNSIKRIISYLLIGVILVFTIIALLGIWEIIELQEVIRKMFLSLMVIFAASAVILFIFSVMIKDSETKPEK